MRTMAVADNPGTGAIAGTPLGTNTADKLRASSKREICGVMQPMLRFAVGVVKSRSMTCGPPVPSESVDN